jgi:hypothetical protein
MTLEMIGDGKWHGIEELRLMLELNKHEFEEITIFLSKFDFADIDEKNRRVKINKDFRKLVVQTVI